MTTSSGIVMNDNNTTITVDGDIIKAVEEEEKKASTPTKTSTPIKTSTPGKINISPLKELDLSFTKTSTPSKISLSPLKVLELSWTNTGQEDIDWEQAVVICTSDFQNLQETPRQTLINLVNYLLSVRTGLQFTTSQLYAELLKLDAELEALQKMLN